MEHGPVGTCFFPQGRNVNGSSGLLSDGLRRKLSIAPRIPKTWKNRPCPDSLFYFPAYCSVRPLAAKVDPPPAISFPTRNAVYPRAVKKKSLGQPRRQTENVLSPGLFRMQHPKRPIDLPPPPQDFRIPRPFPMTIRSAAKKLGKGGLASSIGIPSWDGNSALDQQTGPCKTE